MSNSNLNCISPRMTTAVMMDTDVPPSLLNPKTTMSGGTVEAAIRQHISVIILLKLYPSCMVSEQSFKGLFM